MGRKTLTDTGFDSDSELSSEDDNILPARVTVDRLVCQCNI